MTLNRSDFPEMTDEQWKAIQAEGDRRATEASQTAKRGLLTDREAQERIDAALEAERQRIEATEAERLELDRKKLAEDRAAFVQERRTLTAKTKLAEADIPAEKIDKLLPLFVGVDDKALDSALETFIDSYKESVKVHVDAEKQALLGNVTPPAGGTGGPVDKGTEASKRLADGDEAGALDILLEQAGYTPTT